MRPEMAHILYTEVHIPETFFSRFVSSRRSKARPERIGLFFAKRGIIGCRGMSELMEWTTSIGVRSKLSGFKVGSTYSEGSVNEEANGNPADSMRDERCVHRMQRHGIQHEDGKEDDNGEEHDSAAQDSVIAQPHTVACEGAAFDERFPRGSGFVLGRALVLFSSTLDVSVQDD